jgi:calcineurin-like phosphoesterase family protein
MENKYIKPMKFDSSKTNIWFTSDTHFYHKNIIKYCYRPFNSVEEMNQSLINNWNNVVKENDVVFHLGDFAFDKWKHIINQLNGKIYLIVGNHDEIKYPGHKIFDLFEGVFNQLYIQIDNQWIYLNHYPFLCYGGSYKNNPVWQLYGHTHSGPNCNGKDACRLKITFPYQYDVGVDNNNYTPVSYNQIKEIINNKK